MMHASMFAARPAVVYFTPGTLAVMERVRGLRKEGASAFYTMDAGPHVKVLTSPEQADAVAAALEQVQGVRRVIRSEPGPDARAEPLR
jgi:diphosphomevalonate decarboxylase